MPTSEHILQIVSQSSPLRYEYDPHDRQFVIGKEAIPLADFESYVPPLSEPLAEQEVEDLLQSSTLLFGILGHLYQLPKMYHWLKGLNKSEYQNSHDLVTNVMIDAYAEVTGVDKNTLFRGDSHWDFGMSLYRPGHPVFRVTGDCACFGVAVEGVVFGERDWNDGFSEYDGHNIDSSAQEVALYAGAGMLARLCRIELAEDARLF